MKTFLGLALCAAMAAPAGAGACETDSLPTAAGELKVTFIGHASMMFEFGGKVIYNDPVGQYGD
ncbi:MBL fold metallo-hydrolase, partial [Citrobacter sp. AAK_AS5]